MATTLEGHCLCGDVKYTVEGEPQKFFHCFCSICRGVTGSAHCSNLFVAGTLKFSSGEEQTKKYVHTESWATTFCTKCGGQVPMVLKSGAVKIPAGSLESDVPIPVTGRIFMGSKTKWACCGDKEVVLPEHDEFPQ